MDSYVCGINTRSEIILIYCRIYFSCYEHAPVEFWYTFTTQSKSDKTRMNQIWPKGTEIWFRTDKKCGRTDGRSQNYIPPTLSGDNERIHKLSMAIKFHI